MSLALNGTDGVTYNDGTLQSSAPVGKNLIINGNMQIAQRATSVTGITTGGGYRTIDRFFNAINATGTWTESQDTDVPTGQGFATSLKMDCTTANGSLSAGSFLAIQTKFEGQKINVKAIDKIQKQTFQNIDLHCVCNEYLSLSWFRN